MTTIKLKNGSGAPTAGDLAQGEPALDLTNKRLYTEDSGGTVIEVGTNPGVDVTFADNRKALFGAGSDLQIYHDGSSSFIKDAGTGNLIIQATDLQIANADNTANYIRAFNGGAVDLRYAGAAKLATTATGIDVTGSVVSDGLTVDGRGTIYSGVLSEQSQLRVGYSSDYHWSFGRENAVTGDLLIESSITGTDTARMRVGNTGDISFYEDTGTTAKFFWDSSAESLGLGTTNPLTSLWVQDSVAQKATFTNDDFVANSAGSTFDISMGATTGSTYTSLRALTTGRNAWGNLVLQEGGGNVGIGTGSPSAKATIQDGDFARLDLNLSDATGTSIADVRGLVEGTEKWRIGKTGSSSDAFAINVTGTERMRIDTSGNVLVGKTSSAIAGAGTAILSSGTHNVTVDGDTTLQLNRLSSHGAIATFFKDGTTVGTIGSNSSLPYFAGTSIGLKISATQIRPSNSTGVNNDNAVDLGKFDTRFKDLYLSSKVKLQAVGGNQHSVGVDANDIIIRSETAGSETARFTYGGNLLVGTTDNTLVGRTDSGRVCIDNEDGNDCLQLKGSGVNHLNIASWIPISGGGYHIGFGDGTGSYTERGVISTDGSVTNYGGTSDYRLKENVIQLTGAINRVKMLSPSRFNFIDKPEQMMDGFIAHEVQAVVPEAVVGEKDALKEDGSIRPQQLDNSKLVPLLTAALQEALEKIDNLESRLLQLEGEN